MAEAKVFSQRLTEAIALRGTTLSLLAAGVGVSVSTAYRWIDGSMPQSRTLRDLAAYLCVRKEWLEGGPGQRDEFPYEESLRTTDHTEPGGIDTLIQENIATYAMTQEELVAYRELQRLRAEIDNRLKAAVVDPSDAIRSRLQRRVDEFVELCRSLRPGIAQAIRDKFSEDSVL